MTLISELTSGLEVISHPKGQTFLVSGYHPSHLTDHTLDTFGLLGLNPHTGQELWRRPLFAKPHNHDCQLIDVDDDGIKDCITVGDNGLMAAINPINGNLIYCFVTQYGIVLQVVQKFMNDCKCSDIEKGNTTKNKFATTIWAKDVFLSQMVLRFHFDMVQ